VCSSDLPFGSFVGDFSDGRGPSTARGWRSAFVASKSRTSSEFVRCWMHLPFREIARWCSPTSTASMGPPPASPALSRSPPTRPVHPGVGWTAKQAPTASDSCWTTDGREFWLGDDLTRLVIVEADDDEVAALGADENALAWLG